MADEANGSADLVKSIIHPFEVGALVRNQVLANLRYGANLYGVDLKIEEDRGWLSSYCSGVIRGRRDKVTAFVRELKRWSGETNRS